MFQSSLGTGFRERVSLEGTMAAAGKGILKELSEVSSFTSKYISHPEYNASPLYQQSAEILKLHQCSLPTSCRYTFLERCDVASNY